MFLSIVGAEAGHMALRSLATGGVYVCGGIPPRVSNVARSSRAGGCWGTCKAAWHQWTCAVRQVES